MHIRKILLTLFTCSLIGASVLPVSSFAAGTKQIGDKCSGGLTGNNECITGQCENASDGKGSFCVCNELDLEPLPSPSTSCANRYGKKTGDTNQGNWLCKDGADATWDLNYCINNKLSKGFFPLNPPKSPTAVDLFFDTTAATQILGDELQQMIKKPQLKINIPGVSFTDVDKLTQTEDDGSTYIYFPYLSEYISAVYRYLILAVGVVAMVVIIYAGFIWITSGGSPERITQAKSKITHSIIGLLLAVGSYTLLYTINPELVEFRNLKVLYVKPIQYVPDYAEGKPETSSVAKGALLGNPTPKGSEKCLYDTFTPGVKIGQKPPYVRVNIFGVANAIVNTNSADAWKKVSDLVIASSDPEIQGYLQYMKDFRDKKVPDLLGQMDGKGAVSSFLGNGIGVSRHTGEPLKKLTYDMHVMGLAVDIMTRSNWDLNWRKTKKGSPAKQYCTKYKKVLEGMKNGDYGEALKSDPYKMFPRLEKNISDCLDKTKFASNPFTSLPKGIIEIFERNGFYWGGWGWGDKLRTDSMHFEYWGNCMNDTSKEILTIPGAPVLEKELYCCKTSGGFEVHVEEQTQCTEAGGAILNSGTC